MKILLILVTALSLTVGKSAMAWGNHSFPAYRAFEKMPEVASAAPVAAEPLEAFLKSEEKTIEALLASHEAWAAANLDKYPARPAALAFIANPKRSDDARRLAFLMALRVAPNSKFALYFQPDPRNPVPSASFLPSASVSTLPESANSGQAFIAIKPGEPVPVLNIIASASAEPDYGLDINLWDDSPSDWGKVYSFGTQPFGNPALSYSTQAPFHMGFSHESRVLYMAAPFIKRTFPLLRSYQFSTLASLAFRTGHPYWGWRFAGLSLHYLQDLTQPYHSSLAPGDSVPKLLGVNLLAMAGLGGMKEDMIVLLSNRHLALEKYQTELLLIAAGSKLETPIERSLRSMDKDRSYPEWSDGYVRDIVSAQSASFAGRISELIVTTMPSTLVSDPAFDFGAQEGSINLVQELAKRPNVDRTALDDAIAQLLGNFGAHSRNAMRGILKASNQP